MTFPQKMCTNLEESILEQGKKPYKEKAVKASMTWILPGRGTRRRRTTERYGIDVVMQMDEEELKQKQK